MMQLLVIVVRCCALAWESFGPELAARFAF